MTFGKFSETKESNNEVSESNESREKSPDGVKELSDGYSDAYNDNFEKKLDAVDSKADVKESDSDDFHEKGDAGKQSLLDKMRNLFAKREKQNEVSENKSEKESAAPEASYLEKKRNEFLESLRVDAPSEERQAEVAKEWKEKVEASKKGNDSGESTSGNDDGESGIQHGEDGERTRYSDAQWRREYENYENER